jgi:hypothetical protein
MKSHFLAHPALRSVFAVGLVVAASACSGATSGGGADSPAPGQGGSGPAPARTGGKTGTGDSGGATGSGGSGQAGESGSSNGSGGGSGSAGAAGGMDASSDVGSGARPDARRDSSGSSPSDAGANPTPTPNPVAGPAGPWARGVRIGLVEVAQGVFIKIGDGSAVVAPAMRNAPLIEGRPLLARVHVATDAGFAARKLRAVLSVGYGDGTKFEIEDTKMISGASVVDRLDTTFNFLVPAENVKPTAAIVASVYEAGADAMGADPMVVPRFPAMAGADLGVKAGKMELDIVFVPDGPLMDTPERRKKLEQDVYDLYPVQKVNFRFHAPVPMVGAFSSSKGFAILRDAREMDGGKPWEYYHYLTGSSGAGFAGVSRGAGATIGAAASRVSITIVRGNAIDGNTNTVAHETGHANGLAHMPGCGAAGPDKAYPYLMPAGDVGGNGYSLSFNAFKSRAMFRELMSYCRPRWISDYVWTKFETRVRIVSGFAAAPATMTQMLATRSLQGFAGPGEAPNWGIVSGDLVEGTASLTADRYALLTLLDGRTVKAPVAVNLASDDVTQELAVHLAGDDFSDGDVLQAEIFVDGQRSLVPVSTMFRRR